MAVRVQKSAVNIREKLAELERPVGITGAQIMKAETPQEAYNLVGSSRKNIIINGSMVVNQRGFTGAAGTTTSGSYTVDRFDIYHSHDGAVSVGQTTMNSTVGGNAYADGFNTALIFRVTTADSSLAAGQFQVIRQRIEGYNVQGIKKGTANAQPITLSFWVRSNTTGTYIVEAYDENNTRQVSQSYSINSANTWEKKTLTYPADTTGVLTNHNGVSLLIQWFLAAGSTYSGGATLQTSWGTTEANRAVGQTNLLATAGNDFFLTGVQLEVGKFATEFERRPYGQELALCQRYYEKCFLYGLITSYVSGGYNYHNGSYTFQVEKRIVPSQGVSIASVSNYQPGGGTGTASISNSTTTGFKYLSGSTNQTFPDQWINDSSTYLGADAEL